MAADAALNALRLADQLLNAALNNRPTTFLGEMDRVRLLGDVRARVGPVRDELTTATARVFPSAILPHDTAAHRLERVLEAIHRGAFGRGWSHLVAAGADEDAIRRRFDAVRQELDELDRGETLDPDQCAHQVRAVTVDAIATRQAVTAPPPADATPSEGQGGEERASAETQTGAGKRATGKKAKGQDINGKMLKMLQDNFDVVVEWGSQRWAQELKCDDSMVRKTKTWKKDLKQAREKLRRERAKRPPEKRAG